MKFLILLSTTEGVTVPYNVINIQKLRDVPFDKAAENLGNFFIPYLKKCVSCGDYICDDEGNLIN